MQGIMSFCQRKWKGREGKSFLPPPLPRRSLSEKKPKSICRCALAPLSVPIFVPPPPCARCCCCRCLLECDGRTNASTRARTHIYARHPPIDTPPRDHSTFTLLLARNNKSGKIVRRGSQPTANPKQSKQPRRAACSSCLLPAACRRPPRLNAQLVQPIDPSPTPQPLSGRKRAEGPIFPRPPLPTPMPRLPHRAPVPICFLH